MDILIFLLQTLITQQTISQKVFAKVASIWKSCDFYGLHGFGLSKCLSQVFEQQLHDNPEQTMASPIEPSDPSEFSAASLHVSSDLHLLLLGRRTTRNILFASPISQAWYSPGPSWPLQIDNVGAAVTQLLVTFPSSNPFIHGLP